MKASSSRAAQDCTVSTMLQPAGQLNVAQVKVHCPALLCLALPALCGSWTASRARSDLSPSLRRSCPSEFPAGEEPVGLLPFWPLRQTTSSARTIQQKHKQLQDAQIHEAATPRLLSRPSLPYRRQPE